MENEMNTWRNISRLCILTLCVTYWSGLNLPSLMKCISAVCGLGGRHFLWKIGLLSSSFTIRSDGRCNLGTEGSIVLFLSDLSSIITALDLRSFIIDSLLFRGSGRGWYNLTEKSIGLISQTVFNLLLSISSFRLTIDVKNDALLDFSSPWMASSITLESNPMHALVCSTVVLMAMLWNVQINYKWLFNHCVAWQCSRMLNVVKRLKSCLHLWLLP